MPLLFWLRRLVRQLAGTDPFAGDCLLSRVPFFGRRRPSLPFPHLWNYREPIRILDTFFHDADLGHRPGHRRGLPARRERPLVAAPEAAGRTIVQPLELFQPEKFHEFEQTFRGTVAERLAALRARQLATGERVTRVALEPEINVVMLEMLVNNFFGSAVPRRATADTWVETADGRRMWIPRGTHVVLDVWHANRCEDFWGESSTGYPAAGALPSAGTCSRASRPSQRTECWWTCPCGERACR